MSRVKVQRKIKKIKTLDNQEVVEAFQDMLTGSSKPDKCDLTIVWPKYKDIEQTAAKYIGLMKTISKSAMMSMFPDEQKSLEEYVDRLENEFALTFRAPDLSEYVDVAFFNCPQDLHTGFGEVYFVCKESYIVKTIIQTCSNLVDYKNFLGDKNKLRDIFLTRTMVGTITPFEDLEIDVKFMYNQLDRTSQSRVYMMLILSKAYTISYKMYEIVTAPDYNINEFVGIVQDSLGSVKSMVPRCDAAFDKILDSVHLLKNNFTDYNRDFLATGNPTIIMENFVTDVAMETKASPSLMGQFRKIIDFYRKQAKEHAQDPTMKTLFAEVDKNMSTMTKRIEDKKKAAPSGYEGEESAEEPAAETVEPTPPEERTSMTKSEKKREKRKKNKMRKKIDEGILEGMQVGKGKEKSQPGELGGDAQPHQPGQRPMSLAEELSGDD